MFKIDKNNAPELWESIGENFVSKVVRPISRSKIASVGSTPNFDQLKNDRPMLGKATERRIKRRVSE